MDLFTIDNVGETELLEASEYENSSIIFDSKNDVLETTSSKADEIKKIAEVEEDDDMSDLDFGDLPRNTIDISKVIRLPPPPKKSELQRNIDKFCKMLDKYLTTDNKDTHYEDDDENDFGKTDVEKELKACVTIGIEKQKSVEILSDRQRIKKAKEERSKSKGKNWFNLPATELTDEAKNDLEIIQMRSVLNPQQFYKKNDLKVLPKYFQIGKVLPSPLDYYNERDTRKTKRKTLVDELMQDAEFQRFNKRKYNEVMEEKKKSGYHKANKKMKKLKKNKS